MYCGIRPLASGDRRKIRAAPRQFPRFQAHLGRSWKAPAPPGRNPSDSDWPTDEDANISAKFSARKRGMYRRRPRRRLWKRAEPAPAPRERRDRIPLSEARRQLESLESLEALESLESLEAPEAPEALDALEARARLCGTGPRRSRPARRPPVRLRQDAGRPHPTIVYSQDGPIFVVGMAFFFRSFSPEFMRGASRHLALWAYITLESSCRGACGRPGHYPITERRTASYAKIPSHPPEAER